MAPTVYIHVCHIITESIFQKTFTNSNIDNEDGNNPGAARTNTDNIIINFENLVNVSSSRFTYKLST